MNDTVERPSYTDDYEGWIAEYAPEYPVTFQVMGGGRRKTVPELKPWSYWSQLIDPAGVIFVYDPERPTDPPWTRVVLDGPFRAAMDKSNYFRNGGRTPIGGDGLDPALLNGAVLTKDVEGNTAADGPFGLYVFQHDPMPDATPATHDSGYVSDAVSNTNSYGPVDYRSELHLELIGDNQYRFGADPPE